MITLGAALRRLRQAAQMTQKELSARLEIDATYLSHLEADRKEPSVQLLKRIASELVVPPGLLIAIMLWADLPEGQRKLYNSIIEKLLAIAAGSEAQAPE
jgi:transcriptional regulator with XRE-family HTH domain